MSKREVELCDRCGKPAKTHTPYTCEAKLPEFSNPPAASKEALKEALHGGLTNRDMELIGAFAGAFVAAFKRELGGAVRRASKHARKVAPLKRTGKKKA